MGGTCCVTVMVWYGKVKVVGTRCVTVTVRIQSRWGGGTCCATVMAWYSEGGGYMICDKDCMV